MSARKVVMLKSYGEPAIRDAITTAAITPGELCEFDGAGNVAPHGTVAANALPAFMMENSNVGLTIDDDIPLGDQGKVWIAKTGDMVNAVANAAISAGDFVESAGNGRVRTLAADAATDQSQRVSVVGQAMEAAASPGDRVALIVR